METAVTKTLIALSLFVLGSAAHAATAGLSLDNRQLTLTDLDPNDGIAAAYRPFDWVSPGNVQSYDTEIVKRATRDERGFWQSDGTPGSGFFINSVRSFVEQYELSPFSALTLSYDALTFASGVAGEVAGAQVILEWRGCGPAQGCPAENGGRQQIDVLIAGHPQGLPLFTEPTEQTNARQMAVTFANTTDDYTRIGLQEFWTVRGGTPPIPEPHSWALMLIGVTGIALAARRRRSAPK